MDLNETIYSTASPSVLGFINKLRSRLLKPHFLEIFRHRFLCRFIGTRGNSNRHVIEAFAQYPRHPKTGESPLAAVLFFPEDDAWQMLVVDVLDWSALAEFSWEGPLVRRNDTWDIGFVQLAVREVPTLLLASEKHYVQVGMSIATMGYPMGTASLTALGKLNQVSPFIWHGIVVSAACSLVRPRFLTVLPSTSCNRVVRVGRP